MKETSPILRLVALGLAALSLLAAAVAIVLAAGSLTRRAAPQAESVDVSASAGILDPAEPEASASAREQEGGSPAKQQTDRKDARVQQAMDQFVTAQSGAWDLYYESLTDGKTAQAQSNHGAEPRSVAASLIKLFVMGAVYDAVQNGSLEHDAVYADLRSMIAASDNDACNRLVTKLGGGDAAAGMTAVNRFAASIGCSDVQMNRLMLKPGSENYVSARDCAAILRMIYQKRLVSADASAEMLALLKEQTVNDRLPAALPQGVTVAHKTGNLPNLSCGDVGIVFTDKGDYILCLISNYSQNDVQTTGAMATFSRTVYDIVTA